MCYDNAAPTTRNRLLTAAESPAYIVMLSPDFWDDDRGPRPIEYVRTQDDNYDRSYPPVRQSQIKPAGDITRPTPTTTTSSQARGQKWATP